MSILTSHPKPTRAPLSTPSSTTHIRALFDTNVYISYLLPSKEGNTVERIVQAAFDGSFTLLMAQEIADEFSRKVAGKKYLAQRIPKEAAEGLIKAILEVAEVIPAISTGPIDPTGPSRFPVVSRDAKDDYLLAYALVGSADYLVTGDDDLLALTEVEGVQIIRPAAFNQILTSPPAA